MEEHEKYWKIVEQALKQLEYNIYCLGDEEILVLNRIIHGYLVSQGVFSESGGNNKGESR